MSCSYSIVKKSTNYYSIGTVPKNKYCKNLSSSGDYIFSYNTNCCYLKHSDLNVSLYGAGADYTQLGITSPQALFLYGLVGVLLGFQLGKNLWGYS